MKEIKMTKILSKIKSLFHRHEYEETTVPRIVSEEHTFGGAKYYYKESQQLVKICKCGKKITKIIK